MQDIPPGTTTQQFPPSYHKLENWVRNMNPTEKNNADATF